MGKDKYPMTQAIRTLRQHKAEFVIRPYKYQERGGTSVASRELGVDEHWVIKTLVMEDEQGNPFLILMHGDREVSTKNLARILGVKAVKPCDPEVANRHTGYVVGGTSPFGTKKQMRVYVEATVLDLPKIYINAGKRGMLAEMAPAQLEAVLKPKPVRVAIEV